MNYVAALQKQLEAMARGFVQAVPSLVIALVVLLLTFVAARFAVSIANRITGHTHLRADLRQLLETLVRLGIWLVGLLLALTIAMPSFTPASALAGLGVGALAIGFAFQDIFENFLAGVLIMLREKMQIGDVIECEGITGKVERITLRETHIRQLSGELTIMPNSILFKNPVKIVTEEPLRRNEIIVGVSYEADLDEAEALIRKAVEKVHGVHTERPILVAAQTFNSSSIDFLVQWWADSSPRDLRITKGEAIKAVKRALDYAGIEIPYPYVTNTFKQPLALDRVGRNPEPVG